MAKGFYYLDKQKSSLFCNIIDRAKKISTQCGFTYLVVPTVGTRRVFDKVGNQSDLILKKEIFCLENRKEDSDKMLILRPEFTALIADYYEQNITGPVRYFSQGALFRYERPQTGRQREFNQINWEIIGENNYIAILDLFYILLELLDVYSLQVTIELNYLPDEQFITKLKDYFQQRYQDLSNVSKIRFNHKNYLRILDSKEPEDQEIINNAPKITIPTDKQRYVDQITKLVKSYNQNIQLSNRLVRGLDYYYGFVWEIIDTSRRHKRQNALGGGGMYKINKKNHQTTAIGMAIGVERWMNIITYNPSKKIKIGQLCLLEYSFSCDECVFIKLGNVIDKKSIKLSKQYQCDYILFSKNNDIILENLNSHEKTLLGSTCAINTVDIMKNIIHLIKM